MISEKIKPLQEHAIYAIHKSGICKRFSSQKETAKACNVSHKSVSDCISGKLKSLGDYAFVSAEEIEQINDDGDIILNQDIIKEKVDWLTRFEMYAFDEFGKYQKFSDRVEAAKTLGISKANIHACLSGKIRQTHGYVLAEAKDIEHKLEDGTIILDEELINKKLKVFKKKQA